MAIRIWLLSASVSGCNCTAESDMCQDSCLRELGSTGCFKGSWSYDNNECQSLLFTSADHEALFLGQPRTCPPVGRSRIHMGPPWQPGSFMIFPDRLTADLLASLIFHLGTGPDAVSVVLTPAEYFVNECGACFYVKNCFC